MKVFQGWRLGAGLLLVSLAGANVLNFIFNAYLGRVLTASDFSVVSLISTLLYLLFIPLNALQSTSNHQAAFWGGRYGMETARAALMRLRRKTVALGLGGLICWLLLSPFLARFFRLDSILPIAIFGLVPLVGFMLAVDRGTLNGRLLFAPLALVTLGEPLIKLLLGVAAVQFGRPELAYSAVPLSVVGVFGLTCLVVKLVRSPAPAPSLPKEVPVLAWRFFLAVLLSGFSAMAFLSFDVLLAKHFLPAEQAGQYALVSLVGKIVFFMGTLSSEFVIPFVSRAEGSKQGTQLILRNILAFTTMCVLPAFLAFGLKANLTIPLLFGARGEAAVSGAPWIAAGTMFFAISRILVSYHIAKRQHSFAVAASALVAAQALLIVIHHETPLAVAQAMALVGALNLLVIGLFHLARPATSSIGWNLASLARLIVPARPTRELEAANLRVLILNWRDTRHHWAGGAEAYLHQLARRLVTRGMHVTLFCGNDQTCPPEDVLDGVEIVRRGGFFTVYAWAFLYYVFKFRGKFDVVLDCENGLPFFSPLYSRKPVVLLLFHVHQEVFIEHLPWPLAKVATFLEGKVMPWIYQGYPVATISESSRADICSLGLADSNAIEIVYPGVDESLFETRVPKATDPLFTYLGRLKPYKNVDLAVRAFALVHDQYRKARFVIAGEGESREELIALVLQLGLADVVDFVGRVSEAEKARLLARSWAALQPSMLEGWGMTVIEANACGTPVIASNVKGLRDAIVDGQTGRLVAPMKVTEFAAEMTKLIEDTAYRTRLEDTAVAWARHFKWDASAEALAGLLLADARAGRKTVPIVVIQPDAAPIRADVAMAGAATAGSDYGY